MTRCAPRSRANVAATGSTTTTAASARQRGAQRYRVTDEMDASTRRLARLASSCALLASLGALGLQLGGVIELGGDGWTPAGCALLSLASLAMLRPRRSRSR